MLEDYYDLLNVSRDASSEEIKRQFRRLAKRYHPDKSEDLDAGERFHQIRTAYTILSDEYSRMIYDDLLISQEEATTYQSFEETSESKSEYPTSKSPWTTIKRPFISFTSFFCCRYSWNNGHNPIPKSYRLF